MSDWAIEGLFKEGTVSVIAGPPGTFKTHMTLDLAINVASGRKWLGQFDCIQAPIYYLAGELTYAEIDATCCGLVTGSGRSFAEWLRTDADLMTIVAMREPNMLPTNPLSSSLYWAQLDDVLTKIGDPAKMPKVWVFDPLSSLMEGVNKEECVKPVMDRFFWLAEKSKGLILVDHHNRKRNGIEAGNATMDDVKGPGLITALADNVIQLSRAEDQPARVFVTRAKARGGAADPSRPAFAIDWTFTPIVEPEWGELVRATVGDVGAVPRAVPGSIFQIERRYIPAGQIPQQGEDHEVTYTAPPEAAEAPESAADAEDAEEGVDTSAWDTRTRTVFTVLHGNTAPASESRLYDQVKARWQGPFGRETLRAILAKLEAQGFVKVEPGSRNSRNYSIPR